MDDNLPIDIHYNKLLDWLISRRHCKSDWQMAALVVREKVNVAIQDMPPVEEITKLLQGTYINYFHCQKIVSLLKDTHDGNRSLFGGYSSQRMKDWLEIVKLYEKEDLYLAEVAQLLTRNVNYELPSLKKQIAKCRSTQSDCTRKESEHAASANVFREKYNASCRRLGIEGHRIGQELLALADDLPMTFNEVTEGLNTIADGVDYYSDFVSFMTKSCAMGADCVPLLKFMLVSGNTTTYQWRVGVAPRRIEEVALDRHLDDDDDVKDDKDDTEIDWGDLGADDIDFGIDLDDGGKDGSIDNGDFVKIEVLDNSGVLIDQSEEEGVARGNDALSLLDNPTTREEFVDQLIELEAFLDGRAHELGRDVSAVHSVQFQGAPPSLDCDADTVDAMLGHTRGVLARLSTDRMRELMLIRNSPRYVDRVVSSLKKLLTDADKMASLSRLMATRRDDALTEERSMQPRVEMIRTRTRELQTQIGDEISKKYQNRRVNIMGEINMI